LERTVAALESQQAQLRLLRDGDKRVFDQFSKEKVIDTAFRQAVILTEEHATAARESNRRLKLEKQRRLFFARFFAATYGWPKLFDEERAFIRQEDLYKRLGTLPTKEKAYYKGVDAALYGLLRAGLSDREIFAITYDLLFGYAYQIKGLEIDSRNPAIAAYQFYRDAVRPAFSGYATNGRMLERMDHQLVFIMHLAVESELSARANYEFRDFLRETGHFRKRYEKAQLKGNAVQGLLGNGALLPHRYV
jgi:hypothetical protein